MISDIIDDKFDNKFIDNKSDNKLLIANKFLIKINMLTDIARK